MLSLNCLILGQASEKSFTENIGERYSDDNNVEIKFSEFKVSHFKEMLFRRGEVKDVVRNTGEMDLWKIDSMKVNEEEDNLKEFTESDIREKLGGELMNPQSSLSEYFNENSFKDEGSKSAVHIIVQLVLWETNTPNEPKAKFTNLIPAEADLSETFNRLSMTEKKSQSYIGYQEILPITGTGMLPRRVILSRFWSTYIKDTPLSYMNSGIVNGGPAIIAYVHVPKGTPVELPTEFEGYPVLLDYGTIEPACHTRPVALSPGISIGSVSACTLGAMFKNETEMEKIFILTTKHSVGNTDSTVIQPGSSDAEKGYTICAKVSKYNFYGVIHEHEDADALLLDYAFCEVINSQVVSTNNTPEFCISNTKDSGSGPEIEYEIRKFGRTTNYTEGVVEDRLEFFYNRKFGHVKTLVVSAKERFGAPGDSGSPVFDKNNTLWGILQGVSPDGLLVSVVPIHLILQHVRSEFEVSFKLMSEI
ncbi:uncharacterized protein OCT59_024085 [Rhizophagus irregularis]|uniref:Crinkler effector protein N-terminal domain-containing protein n=1 Tax=Rhizophagus irregularis (strain DAOM 181602 / DAOM 197198 / MUCL 43194) TaxID=747089 RepID=A0A2H5RVV6_RHIID|nr:hypothetical protein GLOIN_2v1551520 [Rhizophagus irregularis DAOM 181602=DAOM 197198]POG76933.1 hypothetical protein GLOIN_2v1551520 [Rhizophagus irregularis DAOM 181602=DAOM 197198]UZO03681.1 hypothetical protein OCT59_024085 [Rhizophagus irregularis]GBC22226.1 hypothetical protein GLOIN_2v1551520 [Rhizophagus irregularis DAOM 181602=DAOM 197198]|eukprot:XP_025183799.1 hypothetical protein GLOIN_2v1551520 [Rhizophagus irregularis DAOM 181602=DAOM 197198]